MFVSIHSKILKSQQNLAHLKSSNEKAKFKTISYKRGLLIHDQHLLQAIDWDGLVEQVFIEELGRMADTLHDPNKSQQQQPNQ